MTENPIRSFSRMLGAAGVISAVLPACTIVNTTPAAGNGGAVSALDAGVGGTGAGGSSNSGVGGTTVAGGSGSVGAGGSGGFSTGVDGGILDGALVGIDAIAPGDGGAATTSDADAGGSAVTVDCTLPSAAGPAGAIQSTTTGGLWNDASTWVGGKIPATTDHVVIAGEVQVDLAAAGATVTCASVTIAKAGVLRAAAYAARALIVNGDFVNYGAVRNGPPYASYDTASLEVRVAGRFFQEGSYGVVGTHFIGSADQAIAVAEGTSLAGAFTDTTPASALRACSPICSGGMTLTLGTSDAARGTLDMGDQTLTLGAGDLKITNGTLRAGKIVGVAGATLNSDRITTVGTLTLDGDVRTDASTIQGSVKVLATGVLYNVANAAPTVVIQGNLETAGIVRRGPGFAAYGEGDLHIQLSGNLVQNGTYAPTSTKLVGTSAQVITQAAGKVLSGPIADTTPASAISAGSDLTFGATALDLGGGTLDMGDKALTLGSGDFKVTSGVLRAGKIVGVAGATINVPQIDAVGTLVLDGDVRTDATVINGSVKVPSTGVVYNVGNAAPTLTIKGSLENGGIVRRGPGFAAYGEGDLTVDLSGNLIQNGAYTPTATKLTGAAQQTITVASDKILTGSFTDTTPATPIVAGSALTIHAATFDLGATGTFDMGSYAISHPTGDLKIATGVLKANDLTGATDSAATFTVAAIVPPSGTVTVHQHYPTSSVAITGNLVVETGAHVYNEYNVQAQMTVSGTVTQRGTIGSGPGYASYDGGSLYLNGLKMANW